MIVALHGGFDEELLYSLGGGFLIVVLFFIFYITEYAKVNITTKNLSIFRQLEKQLYILAFF
jgi:hypothetical protein